MVYTMGISWFINQEILIKKAMVFDMFHGHDKTLYFVKFKVISWRIFNRVFNALKNPLFFWDRELLFS